MNITVKINPIKYKAATKQGLLNKMGMTSGCFGTYGNTRSSVISKDGVRVFTCEKFRRKTKQRFSKSKGKTVSTVVRPAHWVGYVYAIPYSVLDAAHLKVEQKTRTFQLVARK